MQNSIPRRLSHRDVAQRFPGCRGPADFALMARALQEYQKAHCEVYGKYAYTFLPVAAFKHAAVTCFAPEAAARVFESSGTGGRVPSRHHIRDLALYDRAIGTHWASVFGTGPFTLLAHLPEYVPQSSLVYMAQRLIEWYGDAASGFFLDDTAVLEQAIKYSRRYQSPFILLGAAFGLIRLAEEKRWILPRGARLIETGGMKTYRRSMTREALHATLAAGFGITRAQVWSEYGMCELLSQAYTRGGTLYYAPPWMRVEVFDPEGLEQPVEKGQVGMLGVVDLANVHSVSAIMTEDLGRLRDGGFEVLGRLQNSELRGCNFLLGDV